MKEFIHEEKSNKCIPESLDQGKSMSHLSQGELSG